MKRVLFASAHSIIDFSNGASVATLDVLHGLAASGFVCQAFCTSKLDFQQEVSLEEIVEDLHERYQVRNSTCGRERARLLYTKRDRIAITVIRLESTRHTRQRPEESHAVLQFFEKFLDAFEPDVLVTYGGDPTTQGMISLARARRVPVVFLIHNFGYTTLQSFLNVDYCLVASEFAREKYRSKVGLACETLPYAIDWDRVRATDSNPQFVTFVNPCLEKGVYAFARIADELGRRRPDIPLLVVESRGTRDTLAACGIDAGAHGNIQFMPHTTDCKKFWKVTKIALLPSVWWENQPLVAIESMINGIPVIGSDRGGIPETLGKCGFALPLPQRLTQVSQILPTVEEVEPWVETIIRLWDDHDLYREQSARAKIEAERWHPDRIRPAYAKFFSEVRGGSGPPLVSREHCEGGLTSGLHLSCLETKCQDTTPILASTLGGCSSVVLSRPTTSAGSDQTPSHLTGNVVLSFVVCVSDDGVLQANLLASPCLLPGTPHEVILIKNCPSAADGLNLGLERANSRWVVLLHQDVFLPEGWDRLLVQQLQGAERRFGPVGVAGVYGVGPAREAFGAPLSAERIGCVLDRGRMLREGQALPARLATLDELLLVVPKGTPLRFDPELGYHLYGADLCLQAAVRGLPVVAVDALCHHNSRSLGFPSAFISSAEAFARKWAHRLPVATPCVIIDRDGSVHLLGNAEEGSTAFTAVAEPRILSLR